jgi:hypothetical protein
MSKPKTYADIDPLEPEWGIPGLVPKSFLTVVLGEGGVGKGQWWSNLAGLITTGSRLPRVPESEDPEAAGSVLLVTSEDDPNMSTAWRLRAAGANLAKVYDMTDDFSIPESLPELERQIDEIGDVRLVIIDPLADNLGYVPGSKRQISLTSGNVTLRRHVMRPLERLARRKGIMLVVIHHTVKSGRMAGSKGISDAARMVLRITRPDPGNALRLITVEKTNIAGGDDIVGYTISGRWPDVHVTYVDAPEVVAPAITVERSTIDKIVDALNDRGKAPDGTLTTQALAKAADVDYQSCRTALTRGKAAGKVWSPKRGTWAAGPDPSSDPADSPPILELVHT